MQNRSHSLLIVLCSLVVSLVALLLWTAAPMLADETKDEVGVSEAGASMEKRGRPTRAVGTSTPPATPTPTATSTTANASHFFRSNVTVTANGANWTVQSNGIPDHATGMFPNPSNPNTIRAQNFTFQIPRSPQRAATPTSVLTRGGPIAIAVNGVPFYNPYNAQGQDATITEVFDLCNGHPDQRGSYHYHQNPKCMYTDTPGQHSPMIGYAFDGYEIYGAQDAVGAAPTNLDQCNGHFGPTPQHPEGIYHYHVTTSFPYVIACYTGVANLAPAPR